MGKGTYLGGGTLVGAGPVIRVRSGGKGGLGSGAALREQRRQAEKHKRSAAAAKIRSNEKLLRKVSKELVAEKGRAHYERIVIDERTKVSPLASALRQALSDKTKKD